MLGIADSYYMKTLSNEAKEYHKKHGCRNDDRKNDDKKDYK